MEVKYVDMKHESDDEGKYCTIVFVRVDGIERPDAAALTDSLERCAHRYVDRCVSERALASEKEI